jgi:hypothetical protein
MDVIEESKYYHMAKKNTRVRFLGGYAARKDLFGILSYPVGYDGSDVEQC